MIARSLPRMTPAVYRQMKRDIAAGLGHPVQRLHCKTIQTPWQSHASNRSTANAGPDMQWFWFEGDCLVSRFSTARDGADSVHLSSVAECLSAIALGGSTVVLAERSDLDRILVEADDELLCDDIRMWAELPVSRRVIVLTEALERRYWAQSGLDTSKFSDWVRAFGEGSRYGKGGDINDLISKCRMLGYFVEGTSKYALTPPGASITAMVEALDQTHRASEMRFLRVEQIIARWSEIERFDPINIEQSACTGKVASFASQLTRSHRIESGWVPADTDLSFNVGDRCRLLHGDKHLNMMAGIIIGVDHNDGVEDRGMLVSVRLIHDELPFSPVFIAYGEDLDYVGNRTEVRRWEETPEPTVRERRAAVLPVDVVLAGRVT